MRLIITISFWFCSMLLLFSQQTNSYNSLLWEISGNGLAKKSYLYGTMHVSRRIAFHLTDTFFIALNNCDMVALESNPENWMDQLLSNKNLWADDDNEPTEFYYEQPNSFFESSFNYLPHDDDVLTSLLNAEPTHVNSLLYRSNNYQQSDFEEDTWLDMFIFQTGKKLGKQVGGLEDFMTTVEMSKEAEKMTEKEREEHYKKLQKKSYGEDKLMDKLQDAYRNADLKMLDSLSKSGYTEKYLRIMIHERNKIMANTMDSLMKNKSLFAAMGAAHLPGNQGVIEILKSKGYQVRPVYPLMDKAEKMKSKIESLSYPADFQVRYPQDSSFSIAIPGKIYDGKSFDSGVEYFYPDLANGAYYSIYEISIPKGYTGNNRYIDKVDSLLFEHIPGKTTFKKRYLYENKYPAIELITVNRRGNYERYQFLEFNDYLYMLKLSGTGTYAKEKKHDRFFDSFKFLRSEERGVWREMSYPENGYSLLMPGNPIGYKFEYLYNGQYREIKSTDKQGNTYLFQHNFYCDFDYIEEDTFELSFIANSFLKSVNYTLESFEHKQTHGLPVYQCTATCEDNKKLYLYTALKGADYYLMAVFGGDPPLPYFESLKFQGLEFSETIDYQEDTTFSYSVRTIIPTTKPPKDNLFEDDETEKEDEIIKTSVPVAIDYDVNRIRYFNNDKTNEIIKLSITTIPDYTSLHEIDSLLNTRTDRLNVDGNLLISHLVRTTSDSFDIMEYWVTDTNSTRAIRIKSIFAGDRIYDLFTTMDTVFQSSVWLDTFYQTFMPLKFRSLAKLIPLDSLLTSFITGDSVQISEAYSMLRNYQFSNDDAPLYMNFLVQMNPDSFSVYTRGVMISYLAFMEHQDMPVFLEKLYTRFSDTSNLQLEILELLLVKKEINAYRLFTKLLKIETPVSSDYAQVAYLYDYLYDSVALTIQILPDLLQLTSYPEYKYATYYLTAWLLNQHLISESLLLPYKKDIDEAAIYEFKKIMADQLYNKTEHYRSTYLTNFSWYDGDEDADFTYSDRNSNGKDSTNTYLLYSDLRLNTYSQEKAHCYVDLLLPFYKEPVVKAVLDKYRLLYPSEENLLTNVALLSQGYTVADTIFNYYVKNEKSRILTHELLTTINRLDFLDTTYLTREAFAKSYLLTATYDAQDSIILYKKEPFISASGEGLIYFYLIYNDGNKELGWVAYNNQQTDATSKPSLVYYDRYYSIEDEDIDKKMEQIKASFLKKNRKRLNQYETDY